MTTTDIHSLFARIRQVDVQTATAPTLQAIGGLLWALIWHHTDAPSLLSQIHDVAVRHFREAATAEEQSQWLRVLIHISGGDRENIFADVLDDDEFLLLEALQQEVEHQWLVAIADLTVPVSSPLSALPLMERMQRLTYFYQQDLNILSGGHDEQACAILTAAAACFEQCRTEIFSNGHADMSAILFYYHLLRQARPGSNHPRNASLYKAYANLLDTLGDSIKASSDTCWQMQEISWQMRLEAERTYDRALLPRLSLADPSACAAFRRQCRQWLLTPETSLHADNANRGFAAEGIARLLSWLEAKQSAAIPIPPEREVEIWRTIACATNVTHTGADLQNRMEERLRALKGTISMMHNNAPNVRL